MTSEILTAKPFKEENPIGSNFWNRRRSLITTIENLSLPCPFYR
jgi:hypothetical protein